MTIAQAVQKSRLDRREAEDLLSWVLKTTRAHLLAHSADTLKASDAKRFLALCARRLRHEPFAYLVGHQPFLGHEFLVNEHTLIPRPETEGLTERAIEHIRNSLRHGRKVAVADVGTGTGCIAISIALACPAATVIASDSSNGALAMARKNAKRLGVKIIFTKDDLLGTKLKTRISKIVTAGHDLILVSNPPYLPTGYKKTMPRDVVKYEPAKALFAGKDGTGLIVKLLRQIRNLDATERKLTESSIQFRTSLFLEIDPSQTDKLKKLVHELFPGYSTKIERDLCGRDRYLSIIT